MKRIYVCTDTVTGIFSAIYDAWKSGRDREGAGIALKGFIEQQFFCEYVEVVEDNRKAIAVENLIKKHLGDKAYWDIYHAILADDAGKGDAVLGTMLEAKRIRNSREIMNHLSHPDVEKVFELSRKVGGEAHLFTGFVRFRELENGVLFSEIEPKSQVLTCIGDHFENRFPLENFMIYDKKHRMFLVHQAGKHWVLVMEDMNNYENMVKYSEAEQVFTKLWKGFCTSICIVERKNLDAQRQHLPLRYRKYMAEFTK